MRNSIVAVGLLCAVGAVGAVQYRMFSKLEDLNQRLAVGTSAPAAPRLGGRPSATELAVPTVPLRMDGDSRGLREATVGLIEYSDFECPYCGTFARETLPILEREYVENGRMLMVFRHLPLGSIHRSAVQAAEGAECAADQGRFWEMHDGLFANQKRLDPDGLLNLAVALGLDRHRFASCLAGQTRKKIQVDAAEARSIGFTGTPSFVLGKMQPDGKLSPVQMISGAKPLAYFRNALNEVLASTEHAAK